MRLGLISRCFLLVISAAAVFGGQDANGPSLDGNKENDIVDYEEEENYLRRRLSLLSSDIQADPKTVEAKGYVCSKGSVPWDDKEMMLSEIPSFMEAFRKRNEVFDTGEWAINKGGNGLFHSFIMWVVLRKLRPRVIVESGVFLGRTSWLIAKATEDYAPLLVRVDPEEKGWNGLEGNPNTSKHVDFRGASRFKDITEIDWEALFALHNLPMASYQEETLFLLDDHQDQLRRIMQIREMGFYHVVVDDNFLPGIGDAFSVRDACDGEGRLRLAFTNQDETTGLTASPRRCDNFHRDCVPMDLQQAPWKQYAAQLDYLLDTYWEGPPLAPLDQPYSAIIKYMNPTSSFFYEGPTTWTDVHSKLVIDSTKSSLFDTLAEASQVTGVPEHVLSAESGRYLHMAYMKLSGSSQVE